MLLLMRSVIPVVVQTDLPDEGRLVRDEILPQDRKLFLYQIDALFPAELELRLHRFRLAPSRFPWAHRTGEEDLGPVLQQPAALRQVVMRASDVDPAVKARVEEPAVDRKNIHAPLEHGLCMEM